MRDEPSPEAIAAFSERLREFQSTLEDAEHLYSRVSTHPAWPAAAAANPDAATAFAQLHEGLQQFREGARLMTEQVARGTVTQADIATCDEAHARFRQSVGMFRYACQTLLERFDAAPAEAQRDLN